ncbi:MAG: hypothetical protein WCE75_12730 [Terracidiphilus sp.]
MNPRLARLLVRLYPPAWRARYGEEFAALLEGSGGGAGTSLHAGANVAWAALCERAFPTQGGSMDRLPRSFGAVVRQPSAFLPMAMSLTALAVVLGHIALYGAAREADEGAAAHIWQLLMAGQLPVMLYFCAKWLPRARRQALAVLALAAFAALAAIAPVYLLGL